MICHNVTESAILRILALELIHGMQKQIATSAKYHNKREVYNGGYKKSNKQKRAYLRNLKQSLAIKTGLTFNVGIRSLPFYLSRYPVHHTHRKRAPGMLDSSLRLYNRRTFCVRSTCRFRHTPHILAQAFW